MTIPSLNALVRASDRKPWRLPTRRSRERAAVVARNMTLASGACAPSALVENDPMLLHLAVEDLDKAAAGPREPWRPGRLARRAGMPGDRAQTAGRHGFRHTPRPPG
jgi:hypothetical protein